MSVVPPRPDWPYVALRPDKPHDDARMPVLDDIVVDGHIAMFRAEMMADNHLWMALYLDTGEDIHFSVTSGAKVKIRCTDEPRMATKELA